MDKAYNQSSQSVTFSVTATLQSLKTSIDRFYSEGRIDSADVYKGLMDKLLAAEKRRKLDTTRNLLNAFINQVQAQSGKHIIEDVEHLLIADAQRVIADLK
jgi:hypothetical protein